MSKFGKGKFGDLILILGSTRYPNETDRAEDIVRLLNTICKEVFLEMIIFILTSYRDPLVVPWNVEKIDGGYGAFSEKDLPCDFTDGAVRTIRHFLVMKDFTRVADIIYSRMDELGYSHRVSIMLMVLTDFRDQVISKELFELRKS